MNDENGATPSERALAAKSAAHSSWAMTNNRSARTRPARQRFLKQFEDAVDPERILPDAERTKRAASARRAYFTDLARRSAKARRQRRQLAVDDALRQELVLALQESTEEVQGTEERLESSE